MSSFTRKAIIEAFVKLLNERPLNKITIKDIVEECGINRNTFYYHFRDVPDLIEAIVHEETELIISQNPSVQSFEECLEIAVQFILKNRRANLHIFNSTSRDMYEQHLMQLCRYVVETFLKGSSTRAESAPRTGRRSSWATPVRPSACSSAGWTAA